MARKTIKPGKLVRYTTRFLRSIAWHLGVPTNGIVLSVDDLRGGGSATAVVVWCTDQAPLRILLSNLELDPRHRDAIYPELLAEFGDPPIERMTGIEYADERRAFVADDDDE